MQHEREVKEIIKIQCIKLQGALNVDNMNKIHPYSDNSDLLALFKILYQQKWLILITFILSLLMAFLYIRFSKPVYEVKINVSTPNVADVAELNNGRYEGKKSLLKPITPNWAFKTFILILTGESTKNRFFKSVYYPAVKDTHDKNLSLEFYYNQFKKTLIVKKIPGTNPEVYMVAVQGHKPEQIQEFAKQYISMSQDMAIRGLIYTAKRQAKEVAKSFDNRIKIARTIAREKRLDRITQLEEALAITNFVGKEDYPLEARNNITIDIVSSSDATLDQSLMYRRGSKFLQAEIDILKQRKSDDPFIPELRKLQNQYDFYNTLAINSDNVHPFRMDGADVPAVRISPNKKMIIILASAIGLMLGVFLALIRNLKKTRKVDL
ncbi:hypothetical protein FOG18_07100 [Legionella israelensis]|uniref:LPS O-antigen chain length determinant protein WzzB n=1 Tax=Legionella israelensis TaxID=454 RepID=UPI00117D7930|nr:Wzz/FepE/Etk N-terminal domain-containing protein [Legionella israelensis]QDP72339.1 hypothetical protein FOG18_07100 [Legionella israelensis]